eukprot:CAMPEP_0196733702 /NCGR_PEP_ID=MMETSP1091-20130531/12647_1 /TAXON_ID=302021 /ORGANISM="Rhodomonas sp., Strain CCMP768" /LENGTH=251 /DNA_ID=CAMNT_0042077103 /DNA_START=126 /DNA_END=882 /DNA_ORIENTATION=+
MAAGGFSWKMLFTPFIFYIIQSADVDWTDSFNLNCARGLFAVVAVANAALKFVLYQKITSGFDERRVRTKPSPSPLGEPVAPREITVTDHDTEEWTKSLRVFCAGLVMVLFLHSYYGWVLPLIFHSIHQPIQNYESPLFQIHIMGESDSGEGNPLKRPWSASSNMMEEVWHRAHMMDPKKREEAERQREKKKAAKKLAAAVKENQGESGCAGSRRFLGVAFVSAWLTSAQTSHFKPWLKPHTVNLGPNLTL